MESREGMNSVGVTVIAAEAPSSYHVAPRSDNSTQITGLPLAPSPGSAVMGGMSGKKKRGRPRKYGPDGAVARTLSPLPISASHPPAAYGFSSENKAASPATGVSSAEMVTSPVTGLSSADKPRKGRPIGSQNKPRHNIGSENLGELVACSSGGSFTPHTITVNAGEDVTRKIIALSQQGPRAICVISANGMISNVTLRQFSSGGTFTYEGKFDILTLTGSFTPAESGGSNSGRVGGMSITLAHPNGHVVGGLLAGLLIAASPVQVVLGSFLPSNQLEKPKKLKSEPKQPTAAKSSISRQPPNVDQNNLKPGVPNYSENPNIVPPSTYQTANWPTMTMMQDARKSTDINISLQEE